MKLLEMNCPNCGARLKLASGADHAICEYCDSRILIDNASEQEKRLRAAEEEGYRYEKGRQRALREERRLSEEQSGMRSQTVQAAAVPQRRNTAFWVLGWLFIFPIPATVLIIRSRKLSPAIKALLTAAVWLLYIGMVRS